MRPNSGDVIGGKYRIQRMIGDGGMGAVYEARHELLGTQVALKFLHSELSRRPGLASRFLQEARVSASIQSPHVTRVTDVDQAPDGTPFIVMELLTGESLQQLLDRRPKLPVDQAIDFALQILSGLEAAHALGVVHRDLKPDNVFITPSSGGPVVRLLDFGIAKLRQSNEYTKGLTRPGAVMGTPEYMAPEQLYAADKVDHRADLYSLGAITYEMLSGERPAYGDDAASIIAQVAQGKVKRLTEHDSQIPRGLADVVHRSISADKNQRYQSAQDMRLALAPFAGQLSHAGRLAATPAPASEAPPQKRPPPTMDTAPLPEPKRAVPKTLPPADEPAPQHQNGTAVSFAHDVAHKGSTQEASKELIRELTGQMPQRSTQPPEAHSPTPAYTPAAPAQYPQPHYGPAPAGPGASRKKPWGAALALLLGVVVTGGIILAISLSRRSSDNETSPIDIGGTPPNTTISAQGPNTDTPATPVPPSPNNTTTPTPTKTGGTGPSPVPKTDAGKADSGAAADAGPFQLPPLPTGFPPIPSGFPTALPTTLPTIPGFGQPPPDNQ